MPAELTVEKRSCMLKLAPCRPLVLFVDALEKGPGLRVSESPTKVKSLAALLYGHCL
jgi:hypothetical protein